MFDVLWYILNLQLHAEIRLVTIADFIKELTYGLRTMRRPIATIIDVLEL